MSDYTSIVVTFITGLATGLISGLIIQRRQFSNDEKTGKRDSLFPFIRLAYPIVERLKNGSDYANTIQFDDVDFNNVLNRIDDSLEQFELWFIFFKEQGMIPVLDSLNGELLNHLVGIANYSSQKRRNGVSFLSQNIDDFSMLCESCEELL